MDHQHVGNKAAVRWALDFLGKVKACEVLPAILFACVPLISPDPVQQLAYNDCNNPVGK